MRFTLTPATLEMNEGGVGEDREKNNYRGPGLKNPPQRLATCKTMI